MVCGDAGDVGDLIEALPVADPRALDDVRLVAASADQLGAADARRDQRDREPAAAAIISSLEEGRFALEMGRDSLRVVSLDRREELSVVAGALWSAARVMTPGQREGPAAGSDQAQKGASLESSCSVSFAVSA